MHDFERIFRKPLSHIIKYRARIRSLQQKVFMECGDSSPLSLVAERPSSYFSNIARAAKRHRVSEDRSAIKQSGNELPRSMCATPR
ncbi:MAG TPA: hypothetical protein VF278_21110 [Pirellulales bacterium]